MITLLSRENLSVSKFICFRILTQLLDHSGAFLFASITGISNSSAIFDTVISPSRNAFFTRLESGNYNPSLRFLQKSAGACDKKIEIRFIPKTC
ncbi:MAG: hypothetical protein ACYCXQ_08705 [Candidatus Humimicrobiaceae bacterium]